MEQCQFPDCGGVDCPCTARTSPTSRFAPAAAAVPRTEPTPAVGADSHAQYMRDLEVIERCEQCIVEQAGCPAFFACMGDLEAGRAAQ